MHALKVTNMTCGHCTAQVTGAIRSVDPAARITIDLTAKQIRIDTDVEMVEITSALAEAGYPAEIVQQPD